MERSEILDMLRLLQLGGMRAAYDEIVTTGIKRQHGIEKVLGGLLQAEIAEKQARSIRYQMAAAKRPVPKELADFTFAVTPINEPSVARSGRRCVPRPAAWASLLWGEPVQARATSP